MSDYAEMCEAPYSVKCYYIWTGLDVGHIDMPKPKLMITLEHVKTQQCRFLDADDMKVHIEQRQVHSVVGKFLLQTGLTCSFAEAAVAVQNAVRERWIVEQLGIA